MVEMVGRRERATYGNCCRVAWRSSCSEAELAVAAPGRIRRSRARVGGDSRRQTSGLGRAGAPAETRHTDKKITPSKIGILPVSTGRAIA